MLLHVKIIFEMTKKSQQKLYVFIVTSKCYLQFFRKKVKHFGLRKKKQIGHKMSPQTIIFHRRNNTAPLRMKIAKHACNNNTNIYKKIDFLLKPLLFFFGLLVMWEIVLLGAKTLPPEKVIDSK